VDLIGTRNGDLPNEEICLRVVSVIAYNTTQPKQSSTHLILQRAYHGRPSISQNLQYLYCLLISTSRTNKKPSHPNVRSKEGRSKAMLAQASASALPPGVTDPNYRPLPGRLGNLTVPQQHALDTIRKEVQEEGAFVPERMDDATLLR
jgi:hypothetical protein